MITNEEYYEIVKHKRELLKKPEVLRCTCPNVNCEWHGKCVQCVALHRCEELGGESLPFCLHPMLKGKIEALAAAVYANLHEKSGTPQELSDYVKKRDAEDNLH